MIYDHIYRFTFIFVINTVYSICHIPNTNNTDGPSIRRSTYITFRCIQPRYIMYTCRGITTLCTRSLPSIRRYSYSVPLNATRLVPLTPHDDNGKHRSKFPTSPPDAAPPYTGGHVDTMQTGDHTLRRRPQACTPRFYAYP